MTGPPARAVTELKQYLRFSAGAAEQDVLDELAKSFNLAERKAVLAGPGTGSATPGTNDPTLGVYTALAADSPTFTTAFAAASASTILGNGAAAIAQGIKALVKRGQTPTAAVMDAETYWSIMLEGSDTAGFYLAGAQYQGGARGFVLNAEGQLSCWGVPVFWENYYDSWTSTTKTCIVGNWRKLKVYRGTEFRIDTSDIAGSRWDLNLVGFRGEEELGINAHTAVSTGAFQLVTGVIP